MKRLIEKIYRSAQRLRDFWELSEETREAEYMLKREIRLHLWYSLKLFLKNLFQKKRKRY